MKADFFAEILPEGGTLRYSIKMPLRSLLILALLTQHVLLPMAIAHGPGGCGAETPPADVPANTPSDCCASRIAATTSDQTHCSCVPNLCACDSDVPDPPTPPAPTTRGGLDQVVMLLTLPPHTPVSVPKTDHTAVATPGVPPPLVTDQLRFRAILCIWLT